MERIWRPSQAISKSWKSVRANSIAWSLKCCLFNAPWRQPLPLSENLLKRFQCLQFSAASFITGRYVNSVDTILKLGLLPMRGQHDWHLHEHWPRNMTLETISYSRTLCSSETIIYPVIPLELNTFRDCESKLFNSLPAPVKSCTNFGSFSFTSLKERSKL